MSAIENMTSLHNSNNETNAAIDPMLRIQLVRDVLLILREISVVPVYFGEQSKQDLLKFLQEQMCITNHFDRQSSAYVASAIIQDVWAIQGAKIDLRAFSEVTAAYKKGKWRWKHHA